MASASRVADAQLQFAPAAFLGGFLGGAHGLRPENPRQRWWAAQGSNL